MTFDQWIDAVDAEVRRTLGSSVTTEELSWDSATWVGPNGTAYAALAEDEATARISFENGADVAVAFGDALAAGPAAVGAAIAGRLTRAV